MAAEKTLALDADASETLKPSRASLASNPLEASQVPILEELPAAHVADEMVMDTLWGDESQASTGLEYIQTHAVRMRARILREDPHTSYIPLRSKVPDVRLFKVATLVATTPLEHERSDFRGVTRVPGSLETVLGLLASDDARESYWVALNTQRGLLVHSLVASRRLDANAPFPRWNQRYSAIKFSRHAPPVECCVSEYAGMDDSETADDEEEVELASRRARLASQDLVSTDGTPLRRAFVYRRSIDHRLFNMDDVQAKLRKYDEHCERLYLQDWLYEIAETTEKHICKVVLTCSAYMTNGQTTAAAAGDDKATQSMRHEFREYCTNSLQSLRHILSNQWVERMTHAGVVGPSPGSLLARSFGRNRSTAQAANCGVCSAPFSLLKKRHVCHACALVVCSRCCIKQEKTETAGGPSSGLGLLQSAHDLRLRRTPRECILCCQFGADGASSRVSVSIHRHFSSTLGSTRSVTTTSSELDETLSDNGTFLSEHDEEVSVVDSVDDLDVQATTNQTKEPTKRVRASTEDNTITTGWREPEPELPLPRHAQAMHHQPRRFKQRCDSVNIPPRTGTSPGLVLLSEIDTLSLTGSFRLESGGASGSRRGSNGSDASSTASGFVRASPPLPPAVRRAVSDHTVLPPSPTQAELDDLANFNLKML